MNAQPEALAGHGEAMDRMYRFQRHIYDASRRYYLLGRDTLLDRLQPPAGGSVLEIGCGTGRNLIGAARRYPDARLFGVDISEEMLKTASRAVARSGAGQRMKLACADATGFDAMASLGLAGFDRVVFSYTLSMIPGWREALRHGAGLLAPGGELHVADFGECERLPRAFRAGLHLWLGRFGVTPRATLPAVMGALAAESGRVLRCESHRGGYAWLAAMVSREPPNTLTFASARAALSRNSQA